MDIVYATDNNFIEVLYASISSLYETNASLYLNIWIIADKVSAKNKERINELASKNNQNTINWIENIEIPFKLKLDRGSISSYSRLFLGEVLPKKVKKVLYLDCDIIIMDSLSGLFDEEFDGKIIQGVSDVLNKEYKKVLNIPVSAPVFNAGVLYIDLEKWREERIEEKLIYIINKFKGAVIQGDEGVLNAVLFNSYKELSPRYNYMTIFEDMSYEDMIAFKQPVNYYSKEVLEESRKNIIIRHFTTCFLSLRPWQESSEVAHVEIFKKYYRGTYKQVSPSKLLSIYKILPKKMSLHLLGFIQSKIRTKLYRILK
ncbi:putative galactosyl transferase [Streptococcus pneumoniae]|uniref:Putative glycosyl transferase n=1 Tax=Streptococcus pneumoniae TaxID=1313 RepID=I0J9D1_STREE|nr:putative glycosyl transferase [Streptococcus pneumoniae]VNX39754.1 putative galactosyl transferase [Streptococcus pneumoniae]